MLDSGARTPPSLCANRLDPTLVPVQDYRRAVRATPGLISLAVSVGRECSRCDRRGQTWVASFVFSPNTDVPSVSAVKRSGQKVRAVHLGGRRCAHLPEVLFTRDHRRNGTDRPRNWIIVGAIFLTKCFSSGRDPPQLRSRVLPSVFRSSKHLVLRMGRALSYHSHCCGSIGWVTGGAARPRLIGWIADVESNPKK